MISYLTAWHTQPPPKKSGIQRLESNATLIYTAYSWPDSFVCCRSSA